MMSASYVLTYKLITKDGIGVEHLDVDLAVNELLWQQLEREEEQMIERTHSRLN